LNRDWRGTGFVNSRLFKIEKTSCRGLLWHIFFFNYYIVFVLDVCTTFFLDDFYWMQARTQAHLHHRLICQDRTVHVNLVSQLCRRTSYATVKLPSIITLRWSGSNGASCMRSYHPG
jgi:hypothetical protein